MTDRHGSHRGHERSVPDLVLERSRLGELPSSEREEFTRRIDAEPEVRQRLTALERSDRELRRRFEATQLAAGVRGRLATRRAGSRAPAWTWWRAWPLPAGLAIAATAGLVLSLRTTVPTARPGPPATTSPPVLPSPTAPSPPLPGFTPPPAPPASSAAAVPLPPTGEPGVRIKGLRPALSLFRKTAEGSETLADGDAAREGDAIRIGYRPLGRRYGVIVSLDGRGGLTRHLPERGATAARLEARDVVLLAHAYQLDDAPAWERFFFVTADSPFEVATVEHAARQAAGGRPTTASQPPGHLPLPKALEQSTFLLTKERRP